MVKTYMGSSQCESLCSCDSCPFQHGEEEGFSMATKEHSYLIVIDDHSSFSEDTLLPVKSFPRNSLRPIEYSSEYPMNL